MASFWDSLSASPGASAFPTTGDFPPLPPTVAPALASGFINGLVEPGRLMMTPALQAPLGSVTDDAGYISQGKASPADWHAFVQDQQARANLAPQIALGMLGGGTSFAERGALGATGGALKIPKADAPIFPVRELPQDNYLKPLSTYTPTLYRESSPEEALSSLPHSVANVGYGFGEPRRFYADTPDLAIGQGTNKGVRIEYDSTPFQGTINKKPGWEPLFQNGAAEYLAEPQPGANVRDAVKSVLIDKEALANAPRYVGSQYNTLMGLLKSKGWQVSDQGNSYVIKKP